ncbi:MAG: Gfo/Idh/MocA family oxidoreductase [Planctomycetales bacterium]
MADDSAAEHGGSKRFALIGAAGFVAPRHLAAIHQTGNRLVAAVDPHDSVGVLDRYFPEAWFFTEIERFERHLEKMRRDSQRQDIDYISICSPNFLHDAHVRLALRVRAHATCEKPLVVNPWNLDAMADLEQEYGRRIYTVLQTRLHPAIIELKKSLANRTDREPAEISLTYVTRRGKWYNRSWKGSDEKSGGVVMNIGIHFFDALIWLFGGVQQSEVHLCQQDRAAGRLRLDRAVVRWFLSVNGDDLPAEACQQGRSAFRSIQIDGQEIDFTGGFDQLHTAMYEKILAGQGFGFDDARPSIELVHQVRCSEVQTPSQPAEAHPYLSTS